MRFPSEPLRKFTGAHKTAHLSFTPEAPLAMAERSQYRANYPTAMAHLHLYLGEEDVTKLLPSGYLLWILIDLLKGLSDMLTNQAETAVSDWGSDPWQFDLRGDATRDVVEVTLHVPRSDWIVMDKVELPLGGFTSEVIRLAQEWSKWLNTHYYSEISDPEWGSTYRRFQDYLYQAQAALQKYEGSRAQI